MCVRERERGEGGERSVTHADASHNCDQHERERGACARVDVIGDLPFVRAELMPWGL